MTTFAGTPICSMGDNLWTNYVNGFIIYVKGGDVYQTCICGDGKKLEKVGGAPSTMEMGR